MISKRRRADAAKSRSISTGQRNDIDRMTMRACRCRQTFVRSLLWSSDSCSFSSFSLFYSQKKTQQIIIFRVTPLLCKALERLECVQSDNLCRCHLFCAILRSQLSRGAASCFKLPLYTTEKSKRSFIISRMNRSDNNKIDNDYLPF